MRKAARVFPDPVGADTRTSRPARMAGQASSCGAVAAANRPRNHSAVRGWKSCMPRPVASGKSVARRDSATSPGRWLEAPTRQPSSKKPGAPDGAGQDPIDRQSRRRRGPSPRGASPRRGRPPRGFDAAGGGGGAGFSLK